MLPAEREKSNHSEIHPSIHSYQSLPSKETILPEPNLHIGVSSDPNWPEGKGNTHLQSPLAILSHLTEKKTGKKNEKETFVKLAAQEHRPPKRQTYSENYRALLFFPHLNTVRKASLLQFLLPNTSCPAFIKQITRHNKGKSSLKRQGKHQHQA